MYTLSSYQTAQTHSPGNNSWPCGAWKRYSLWWLAWLRWPGDLGYQKHFRVEHGNNEFANKHSHLYEIESFWAFAKTRLVRFRGLHKHTFYFHLKECEFRFNHRHEDIYKSSLKCSERILSANHNSIFIYHFSAKCKYITSQSTIPDHTPSPAKLIHYVIIIYKKIAQKNGTNRVKGLGTTKIRIFMKTTNHTMVTMTTSAPLLKKRKLSISPCFLLQPLLRIKIINFSLTELKR